MNNLCIYKYVFLGLGIEKIPDVRDSYWKSGKIAMSQCCLGGAQLLLAKTNEHRTISRKALLEAWQDRDWKR